MALSTVNCSNNDDNESTEQTVTQNNILGKWYSDSSNPDNINLEFLSSGRVTFTYIGSPNVIESGDWSISNNTLKIHWDSADPGHENWSAEILNLTNSQLKWKEKIDGQFYNFSFHR